ncbi:glyoxalase [Sphingomonas sp. Root710]|uniref:VOC family protein n=1 Tax=Sphingomonas sp. Root710 TaxID=1736594 RepID=UPI0006FE78DA|nr:VOC family protein [Sphingomonas sp. Root710]KRB85495.1 glyoxalase [Sphingomonas sp. Root710]
MAIVGIERLTYAVENLETSTRFFEDFGLTREEAPDGQTVFLLPEGSRVVLLPHGHSALPTMSKVVGDGVQEIIWGVDSVAALEALVAKLAVDCEISRGPDGAARFVTPFGIAMGLRVFAKTAVTCAPDPLNAPGHVGRMNQHRKWRRRARPKVISHCVFAVADFDTAYRFMIDRLGFRLTDIQRGFGTYLRADGAINHHSFLLLNANAPLPDMDGQIRFHHANFGVEDVDEIMIGANYMQRRGWEPSHFGLGRHRIDSALFYYLPCPAGGEAEYGADTDYVDDSWVPRDWTVPLFGYAHHVHNLPSFLIEEPAWEFKYLGDEAISGAKS